MRTVKLNLILLFSIAITLAADAQLQPAYSFPKDDTALKNNYYQQSLEKKELLLASLGKQYAKDYKEIYEEQFREIAKLWRSSRAITSPDAHKYLQSIAEKIIVANPELKGMDPRIVFSRDWWPNAFSMGDGSIAINAGLVIFMDNEAELVFVLCHELAHYYLEHTPGSIKKYVETINSDEYQNELRRLKKTTYGVNQQLEKFAKSMAFDSRRHNRDNEAAADRQAFLFMKKTGYDCGAIKTSLELLDKVDDSSLYRTLELPQLLNLPDYPFKKKWIQEESAIFSKVDDNSGLTKKEKDSLKTHPDCNKRIALLSDDMGMNAAGKKFLVSETTFNRLKKEFFLEIVEECYREKNLSRNLYYSLLLLQADDNKQVAIYSIARCLNTLYDMQKNHKLGLTVDTEYKGYREDYNLLLRMLSRLRLDELASLNYAFCIKHLPAMNEYPGFQEEMTRARKIKEQ